MAIHSDEARAISRPAVLEIWLEHWAAWILAAVFVLQVITFSTFTEREIVWAYGFYFDQSSYLQVAYENYDTLLNHGIVAALSSGLRAPVAGGALLPLEAALVFSVFGLSRKVAIALHLAHWLVCQLLVFLAARKMERSASWGLAAVGLLLTIPAPMALVGGMFDFRFDLPAMTMIGSLAALAVLSDGFAERKWSVWFGLAATYAIWMRHLLLAYIGAGLALYGAFLLLSMIGATVEERRDLFLRFGNWVRAGTISALAVTSLLLVKFDVLYNYYYIGHLYSAEKDVRAAVYGAQGLARYTYYFKSVIEDQLGTFTLILLGIVLSWQLLGRLTKRPAEPQPGWRQRGDWHSFALVMLTMAASYAILTYDTSKSPIVGNIFAVPVVLAVLLVGRLLSWPVDPEVYPKFARVRAVVSLIVFAVGTAKVYQLYSRHTALWAIRDQMRQAVATHLQIGEYVQKIPGARARLFSDRNSDYQNAAAIMVSHYEHTGQMIHLEDPVGGNVMLDDWARFKGVIEQADIALVTEERLPGDEKSEYPTTRLFAAHLDDIKQLANAQMARAGGFQVGEHKVALYLRSRVEMIGDSGGWLTSKGVLLHLRREWLQGKSGVALEGQTILAENLKGKLGGRAKVTSSGQELPVYVSPVTGAYRIEIDTTNVAGEKTGELEIALTFDRFWVPAQVTGSPDKRELVVRTPASVTLLTAPRLARTPVSGSAARLIGH